MITSPADGTYPRPQLRRTRWHSLDGDWAFAFDDDDVGRFEAWFAPDAYHRFDRQITVPFPPESLASGVGDLSPHEVLWYRREVTASDLDLRRHGAGSRVLLHFGAVDYRADVWFDGQHVGHHAGGQTPFTIDLTTAVDEARLSHVMVVRSEDDPTDISQPRGKQTWRKQPDKVWYERTSGIWQSVWLETVPAVYITDLWWRTDPADGVEASVELSAVAGERTTVAITLELDGRRLGYSLSEIVGRRIDMRVPVAGLGNGIDREDLEWSPERPALIDAMVSVIDEAGRSVDEVHSYVGIRAVGVDGGRFLLNGRPYYLRGVLNQGYRPATLLANRGTEELRAEIELAKSMGFNMIRIHQKTEDPRFLYWADRLGVLVWTETGATYEFSSTAMQNLLSEWMTVVRRDRSHPSVIAWVPINESWGFPNLSDDPAQQAFSAGIANLTRAMDPSRPVMSNEGWEHVDSDILGIHDYTADPDQLIRRYGDAATVTGQIGHAGDGAGGRVVAVTQTQIEKFRAGKAPLMITEFGGLSLRSTTDAFAYTHLHSDSAFAELLERQFNALRSCPTVVGFCYTQLTDTAQETNGLADEHGKPKLPIDTIRAIVTGVAEED